jgi:hypothetical protein
MNRRERILTIVVAAMVLIVGVNWLVKSVRNGFETRNRRLSSLASELQGKTDQQLLGAQSDVALAEYRKRSLPSNDERAIAEYQAWLRECITSAGVSSQVVDYTTTQSVGKLYKLHAFTVSARGNLQQLTQFLHSLHSRHYLQRMRTLSLQPTDKPGELQMQLAIDGLALLSALPDQPAPPKLGPRGERSYTELLTVIGNRNMFSEANRAPAFSGEATPKAIMGRNALIEAGFKDPDEGQTLTYSMEGAPAEMRINPQTGAIEWEPKEVGEFKVLISAHDSGLPQQSAKQELVIKVEPPPPPEQPAAASPEFDDAKQARLTGLINARGQWRAWINVPTKSKLWKLSVGDELKIGTVSGTITEVNDRFVEVDSGGERWTLTVGQTVGEARASTTEN